MGLSCGERLRIGVTSSWFANVANFLVACNVVLMCLPYEGMPRRDAAWLERAVNALTGLFILEMALKLTALGCQGYWADVWNRWDGIIVSLSVAEWLAEALALRRASKKHAFICVLTRFEGPAP